MSSGQLIFISYRRKESLPSASRIYDHLKAKLGPLAIFMDYSSIDPGVDFMEKIEDAISGANVVLAIIGPNWSHAIDSQADYVRLELQAALRSDVAILPVLVDGAKMPDASSFPAELAPIARLNAMPIRHADFTNDMDRLLEAIKARLPLKQDGRQSSIFWFAGFGFLVVVMVMLWISLGPRTQTTVENLAAPSGMLSTAIQGNYCVVANTFISYGNALEQLEQLRRNGYSSALMLTDLEGRYLVCL